jgi:phosphoribosylaminoimidazole-succinocarboxamide synthase
MGKEGQLVPEMTDQWVNTISGRYIELYELLIGKPFIGEQLTDTETDKRIIDFLHRL